MVTSLIKAVAKQPVEGSVQHSLAIIANSKNQEIVLAPLSIPLSEVFLHTDDSDKQDIQGYIFQNRAFESEDDKEPEKLLKAGAAFMEISILSAKDWHYLFSRVCEVGADINDTGVELHAFYLNLAAGDLLELFAPEEMDSEGKLFYQHLAAA